MKADIHIDEMVKQLKPGFIRRKTLLQELFGSAEDPIGLDVGALVIKLGIETFRVQTGPGNHAVATYFNEKQAREALEKRKHDPLIAELRNVISKMTQSQKDSIRELF